MEAGKSSSPHDLSDASSQMKRDFSDASESESRGTSDSESTFPSRCSSIVSYDDYEYNPDDFPKACEIEEFQSPSFQWPPSRTVSRNQRAARPASIQYSNLPKKLAAKLQAKQERLSILLSLWEAGGSGSVLFDSTSVSNDIVQHAQQTVDRAFGLMTETQAAERKSRNASTDLMRMVDELETAISKMRDLLKIHGMLAKPIQLAEHVVQTAGEVQAQQSSYTACQDLKVQVERLAGLLWKAGHADLYERPTPRILEHANGTLHRAASLVNKCRAELGIARRVFTIIPSNAFKKTSLEIENAIGDISWLLRVSKSSSAAATG